MTPIVIVMKTTWLKRIGAALIALFLISVSALLGSSFCLCTEDFDDCGTAHCDCFESDSDVGCNTSNEDGCTDLTIDAIDAIAGHPILKLITAFAFVILPHNDNPEPQVNHLTCRFIPPKTAPPWFHSSYLATSYRLYPRS